MYDGLARHRVYGSRGRRGSAEGPAEALQAAASEALRRAGGALPVTRLGASLDSERVGREPLARCLRERADLFLVVERPPGPWREQDWTAPERAEYEEPARRVDEPCVVLVDGSVIGVEAGAPALLRETLLSMWSDDPEDEELREVLGRVVHEENGASGSATARHS